MIKLPKKLTIAFYEDPGHGWAKVKKELLHLLNIHDKISGYSYRRDEFAYLEEDCDLSLLCDKLKEINCEYKFKIYHSNKSSKIRSYASYSY